MLTSSVQSRLIAGAALLCAVLFVTPGRAHAVFLDCQIDGVGEVTASYGPRIHAHCVNSITLNSQVIQYIAIASSSPSAQRFLSLLTAAMLAGKRVRFDIHNSSAGGTIAGVAFPANVAGCSAFDCRTPASFDLIP
jgi:hypothetical protein